MSLLSTLTRKWRSLWAYGWHERLLIIPVFCILALGKAMIFCLPFRKYVWVFGEKSSGEHHALNSNQQKRARSIGKTVRMVAKLTPWQSLCLPQAIAACLLLRTYRIPYEVHFGVMSNTTKDLAEPLLAHVWVIAGVTFVTGGDGHTAHTVVASFHRP